MVRRRNEISQEADFYGSMDGASKFVRGDAVAGLLITGINLIGGLIVGSLQMGMTLADAANKFSILTIGDGLVAQIPAWFQYHFEKQGLFYHHQRKLTQ